MNCKQIARLDQHVDDLAIYSKQLRTSITTAVTIANSMYDVMVVNQILPALANTVNYLLYANNVIISNIVDAARGRVKDFLRTLTFGIRECKLKPLFEARSIHHYYPLLESVLMSDALVVHVPLQSADKVHKIEPFPFTVNGTIMTLDLVRQ